MAQIVAQTYILQGRYDFVSYPISMYYLDDSIRLKMATIYFAFSQHTLVLIMRSVSLKIRFPKIYYGLMRFSHHIWSILNNRAISKLNQFLFKIRLHCKMQKHIIVFRPVSFITHPTPKQDSMIKKEHMSANVAISLVKHKQTETEQNYKLLIFDQIQDDIIKYILHRITHQRHFAVFWSDNNNKSLHLGYLLFPNKYHLFKEFLKKAFVTQNAYISKHITSNLMQGYIQTIERYLRLIMHGKLCYTWTNRIQTNKCVETHILPIVNNYAGHTHSKFTLVNFGSFIHQIATIRILARVEIKNYVGALHKWYIKRKIIDELAGKLQYISRYINFADQDFSTIMQKDGLGGEQGLTSSTAISAKLHTSYILKSLHVRKDRRSYSYGSLPCRLADLQYTPPKNRHGYSVYTQGSILYLYPAFLHCSHGYRTAGKARTLVQIPIAIKFAMPANSPHPKADKAYRAWHGRLSHTSTEKQYQSALQGGAKIYSSIFGKSRRYVDPYSGNKESTRQANAEHKYQEMRQPKTPRQAVYRARFYRVTQSSNTPRQEAVPKHRSAPHYMRQPNTPRQAVYRARFYQVMQSSNTPHQESVPKHRSAPHKSKMQLQQYTQLRASMQTHSRKLKIGNRYSYSTESAAFTKDRKARQIASRASTPRTGKKREFDIYDRIISYYLSTIHTYILGLSSAAPCTSTYYVQRYMIELAPPLQQIILSGTRTHFVTTWHSACHVLTFGVTFNCVKILDNTNAQHISIIDHISNTDDLLKDASKCSYYSNAQNYGIEQKHYDFRIKSINWLEKPIRDIEWLQTRPPNTIVPFYWISTLKIPNYKIHFKHSIIDKSVRFYNVAYNHLILLSFKTRNIFNRIYGSQQWISNITSMLNYAHHFKNIGINLYDVFLLIVTTHVRFRINFSLKQLSNQDKLSYILKTFLIL